MTGDKVDKATMTYGNREDIWVANKVRMLMRDDLDHEFVCVGARDRIMYLSQEVERLTALCDEYRGEVAALKVENGRLREELGEEEHDISLTDKLAMSESVAEQWMNRAEKAESALTRARAEGMEEAAKIAERSCDDCAADIRATIRGKENQ